jgi:glutamine amidotransferase-like uncharacterized protein
LLQANELVRTFTQSAARTDTHNLRIGVFNQEEDDDANVQLGEVLDESLDGGLKGSWQYIKATDIRTGTLDSLNGVVFPGGNARQQSEALAVEGRDAVRKYVQSGGGYLGICAGAYLATAQSDWCLGLINTQYLTGDIDIPGVGMRSMSDRGIGIVKIELTEAGKAIFGRTSGLTDVRYTGGPIFCGTELQDLSQILVLARFRTEIAQYEAQRGTMVNTPAIIASRYGKGRVFAISPHPEMTSELKFVIKRAVLAMVSK